MARPPPPTQGGPCPRFAAVRASPLASAPPTPALREMGEGKREKERGKAPLFFRPSPSKERLIWPPNSE